MTLKPKDLGGKYFGGTYGGDCPEPTGTEKLREEMANRFRLAKGRLCVNQEEYKFADQILQACKEAGLKFVPDEWDIPDAYFFGKLGAQRINRDIVLRAISSQIKEIDTI